MFTIMKKRHRLTSFLTFDGLSFSLAGIEVGVGVAAAEDRVTAPADRPRFDVPETIVVAVGIT